MRGVHFLRPLLYFPEHSCHNYDLIFTGKLYQHIAILAPDALPVSSYSLTWLLFVFRISELITVVDVFVHNLIFEKLTLWM
jgi:hypothetical protein